MYVRACMYMSVCKCMYVSACMYVHVCCMFPAQSLSERERERNKYNIAHFNFVLKSNEQPSVNKSRKYE